MSDIGIQSDNETFFDKIKKAWSTAWGETVGNPYYIPPEGGPGSGIIPSTKSAQENFKQEISPRSGAPLLSAGAQPWSDYYLRSRNPIAQSLANARGNAPKQETPTGKTFEEILAEYSFNSKPYDDYMSYLAQQDQDTYNRIQAMYSKLADDAGANLKRVKDVYSGAEQGIADTYAGAQGTTEGAYSSAQQQAADQLARLGIAEAAPDVINPMALSQAEAMSNLAAGEATGQTATKQFGATSQDFASQMDQVAQQQGLEATAAILRDMAQRQAEAAFQRAQAEASYNPYEQAMQRLQAEQAWNQATYGPGVDPETELRAMQYVNDTTISRQEALVRLAEEKFNNGVESGLYSPDAAGQEQAWNDALAAMQRAEATYQLQ